MAKDIDLPDLQEEESSNFDIKEWIGHILHYWYLFVIGLVIAFSMAYLTNRKWIASYYSAGTLIIKEYGSYQGSVSLMSGYGVDAGYKNVNNQVIMLTSYDLMSRVVDSLPFLNVEYMTHGRFKTRNIYKNTPIIVTPYSLSEVAYATMYEVKLNEDGTLHISSTNEKAPLEVDSRYGELIETSHFSLVVMPSVNMVPSGKVFFRFRGKDDLVNEFIGRLGLSFVSDGSSVLQLSLSSETPDRDCDFINKLVDIYLLQNLERKNQAAERSLSFIENRLDILRDSLEVSESAMTDFRQSNKFVDVSSYAGSLISKAESFDAQRMSLVLKEDYLDYLENYLKNNMEAGAIVAPSTLGLGESMLMPLVTQLNDLLLRRAELSERNVYYSKYTNDINNVKNAIYEVTKSMRASLNIEKRNLAELTSKVENDINYLPEKESQMVKIERKYRIDDNYYTFFLQKRAEAEIQKASNTPDNEVLDRARTMGVTNASTKKKTTTKYLLFGILIPLVLVVLSELLNQQIRSPKEVEKLSQLPLLGTLRHARSQNPTLVAHAPRSTYAEMMRGIRTRIEYVVQRKTNIMVAITSTQSGDGKTFLSSNLAALYGMTGKKTILIDMDIRKPNIHEKMGLKAQQGLTNYLIGGCTIEEAIIHDDRFTFDLLPAGTIPPNPGELIRSDKLSALLEQFRHDYEYIVIDTSPIGLVPDAYAIVEQADITLFVIRCLQTNKSFCKSTLEQISINHKDKVYTVLSDIPTEGHSYGYYAGGYGYGYGTGGYGYGGYGYGSYGYGKKYGKSYGTYGKYGKYGKYGDNKYAKYGYGLIQKYGRHPENQYNYYGDEDEEIEDK